MTLLRSKGIVVDLSDDITVDSKSHDVVRYHGARIVTFKETTPYAFLTGMVIVLIWGAIAVLPNFGAARKLIDSIQPNPPLKHLQ